MKNGSLYVLLSLAALSTACETKGACFYKEQQNAMGTNVPYCADDFTKSVCSESDQRFEPGGTCAAAGYKVCPGGEPHRQFKSCSDPHAK